MSTSETSETRAPVRPYPVYSLRFWRAYGITARPYLFFVSGAAGLVGIAAAGPVGPRRFCLAFVPSFLAYGLGQALTDVSQTDTDSISSPYRPLTRGLITARQVLAVSLLGLGLCAAAYYAANPSTLLPCALAVAGLATYTFFKRRWWGGPFWNSWIVATVPLIGFLGAGGRWGEALRRAPLGSVCASIFFSYAVFVLLGYFKDISADRATGYRTLPVVAGWLPSVAVSAVFGALGLGFGLAGGHRTEAFWAFWLAAAGTQALAHGRMALIREEALSHGPIGHCVRSFILLALAETAGLRPELWPFCCVFYLGFEAVLRLRPERTQI
jgi:4-hydroxybenzoate polyprenyltransferase